MCVHTHTLLCFVCAFSSLNNLNYGGQAISHLNDNCQISSCVWLPQVGALTNHSLGKQLNCLQESQLFTLLHCHSEGHQSSTGADTLAPITDTIKILSKNAPGLQLQNGRLRYEALLSKQLPSSWLLWYKTAITRLPRPNGASQSNNSFLNRYLVLLFSSLREPCVSCQHYGFSSQVCAFSSRKVQKSYTETILYIEENLTKHTWQKKSLLADKEWKRNS